MSRDSDPDTPALNLTLRDCGNPNDAAVICFMWTILEELRSLFGAKDETAVLNTSAANGRHVANAVCFIVDDEPAICKFLSAAATASAARPESFSSVKRLSAGLSKRTPGLVFLDISLEGSDAIDGIRLLAKSKFPG